MFLSKYTWGAVVFIFTLSSFLMSISCKATEVIRNLPEQNTQKIFPKKVETSQDLTDQSDLVKKERDYWVLKCHASLELGEKLITPDGKWINSTSPAPKYVWYQGLVQEEDRSLIERWLKLNDLKFFSIASNEDFPEISTFVIVAGWYDEVQESKDDSQIQVFNKLIWRNYRLTLSDLRMRSNSDVSSETIEQHRQYHAISSHYDIGPKD